jgi:hypothetical protein
MSFRTPSKALSFVLAFAVIALPTAAFASHYRSVYSTTSKSGSTVSWTITNATESGSSDSFGSSSEIELLGSVTDAVDSGSSTGVFFNQISNTEDLSNSLYASRIQVLTADVSGLADGSYESFTSTCCRLDGVQNTNGQDSVSAWIRFSVASGVPNLPPVFNNPSLYELIAPNGTVTTDFRATDPEGSAVTYTYLTDTGSPVYAGEAIPCSTFSGGRLTIGPAHCTDGDVFSEIFDADNPAYSGEIPSWSAKIEAKDAAGNSATSDVLYRLLSVPVPEISDDRWVGGSDYELDIFAPDTTTERFSVECVNDADPTDIAVAQGSSSPLTVRNLTVAATYTCTPFAENAAGGSEGDTYELGPVRGIQLALDLEVGAEFSGATSTIVGGGLKAESPYSLTMYSNPIEIYAGISDADGNFSELVTIPAEACIPGIHHLILTGVDPDDQPVSDDQWIELGSDCLVLRISDKKLKATLAATGFDAVSVILYGSLIFVAGLGLMALRRRVTVSD